MHTLKVDKLGCRFYELAKELDILELATILTAVRGESKSVLTAFLWVIILLLGSLQARSSLRNFVVIK